MDDAGTTTEAIDMTFEKGESKEETTKDVNKDQGAIESQLGDQQQLQLQIDELQRQKAAADGEISSLNSKLASAHQKISNLQENAEALATKKVQQEVTDKSSIEIDEVLARGDVDEMLGEMNKQLTSLSLKHRELLGEDYGPLSEEEMENCVNQGMFEGIDQQLQGLGTTFGTVQNVTMLDAQVGPSIEMHIDVNDDSDENLDDIDDNDDVKWDEFQASISDIANAARKVVDDAKATLEEHNAVIDTMPEGTEKDAAKIQLREEESKVTTLDIEANLADATKKEVEESKITFKERRITIDAMPDGVEKEVEKALFLEGEAKVHFAIKRGATYQCWIDKKTRKHRRKNGETPPLDIDQSGLILIDQLLKSLELHFSSRIPEESDSMAVLQNMISKRFVSSKSTTDEIVSQFSKSERQEPTTAIAGLSLLIQKNYGGETVLDDLKAKASPVKVLKQARQYLAEGETEGHDMESGFESDFAPVSHAVEAAALHLTQTLAEENAKALAMPDGPMKNVKMKVLKAAQAEAQMAASKAVEMRAAALKRKEAEGVMDDATATALTKNALMVKIARIESSGPDVCGSCRKELLPDSMYCRHCGANVGQTCSRSGSRSPSPNRPVSASPPLLSLSRPISPGSGSGRVTVETQSLAPDEGPGSGFRPVSPVQLPTEVDVNKVHLIGNDNQHYTDVSIPVSIS